MNSKSSFPPLSMLSILSSMLSSWSCAEGGKPGLPLLPPTLKFIPPALKLKFISPLIETSMPGGFKFGSNVIGMSIFVSASMFIEMFVSTPSSSPSRSSL